MSHTCARFTLVVQVIEAARKEYPEGSFLLINVDEEANKIGVMAGA